VSTAGGAGLPTLGITLPQFSERPGPALAAARDARRLGFGGVFVFDHLWPLGGSRTRPVLECWTLLAAVAAAAEGSGALRVGTLVTRAGLRPPALVARMAATVGQVAGVPPVVGVGCGDPTNEPENLAFGLPFGGPAERARAVEDIVAALRGPLAGSRPTGAPPWGSPDPSAPPEVWVGGIGPGARDLAGRLADGWNGWALTPEELAAGLTGVRRAAEEAGRDPATVAGTWGGQVLVAPDRREAAGRLARWGADRPPAQVARVVAGDPDAVLARLRALGDAGATWCVLATVGTGAWSAAEARAALAAAAGLGGWPARGRIG
jgi:alkanesulfonate monooxygenase SsuD/methylene tetrahydromethanopterin reductase-like flavin-dependent oxidoreductase (luciferase family)